MDLLLLEKLFMHEIDFFAIVFFIDDNRTFYRLNYQRIMAHFVHLWWILNLRQMELLLSIHCTLTFTCIICALFSFWMKVSKVHDAGFLKMSSVKMKQCFYMLYFSVLTFQFLQSKQFCFSFRLSQTFHIVSGKEILEWIGSARFLINQTYLRFFQTCFAQRKAWEILIYQKSVHIQLISIYTL